mgnify:CR=1 FL=1
MKQYFFYEYHVLNIKVSSINLISYTIKVWWSGKINEEYLCEDKRYIIGHLKPELVKDTQLFEDKRISLICFN